MKFGRHCIWEILKGVNANDSDNEQYIWIEEKFGSYALLLKNLFTPWKVIIYIYRTYGLRVQKTCELYDTHVAGYTFGQFGLKGSISLLQGQAPLFPRIFGHEAGGYIIYLFYL